uniref:DZF domain-containing protein n=1 Tax=Panagrolaimus sp. JU765 TaxID=591449 RepID=A0AC34Q7R6_9BILA
MGYHPRFKRPLPFDPYLVKDHYFPRVPEGDDASVTQALLTRNTALTPTKTEAAAIEQMVTKVKKILETIMNTPKSNIDIHEVQEVGSYKKDTMLTKSNSADLVVILKSLPTVELVMSLGQKIVDDLKAEQKEIFGCVSRPFGCEIAGTQAIVKLHITLFPSNIPLLEPDLHLPAIILQQNLAMIRHARWFTEYCNQLTSKVLIRCLKDMKRRAEGWEKFSVWHIELLSHYSIHQTLDRHPLPLSHAFKRFLQLLSTGILLPGSPSLSDPCEKMFTLNECYDDETADAICASAQTMLRVLCHGGINTILGNDPKGVDITTDISIWNGVIVTPLERVFDTEEKEEGNPKPVVQEQQQQQ